MRFNEYLDTFISPDIERPYFTNSVGCYYLINGGKIKRDFTYCVNLLLNGAKIPQIKDTTPILKCDLKMTYGFTYEGCNVFLVSEDSILKSGRDGLIEIVPRINVIDITFDYSNENIKFIDEL